MRKRESSRSTRLPTALTVGGNSNRKGSEMKRLLAAVALALAIAPAASAHWPKPPAPKASPAAQLHYANGTLSHARRVVAWGTWDLRRIERNHRRTLDSLDPARARAWSHHYRIVRAKVRAHRWLVRYATRRRDEALARLLPAHYAGWLCITNGASPTSAHEGNGYNGPYSGPLGMTTPWMGHYPPGSDWVHSNPIDVYRIAEEVMARSGFSYSAMKGQWPNTYPPCAGLFG